MVRFLVYTLIVSLFLLDWLYLEHGIGIRQMTWLPELISIAIFVMIPFQTAFDKSIVLPAKYVVLLLIYIAHLAFGYLLNDVNGWIVLSGNCGIAELFHPKNHALFLLFHMPFGSHGYVAWQLSSFPPASPLPPACPDDAD